MLYSKPVRTEFIGQVDILYRTGVLRDFLSRVPITPFLLLIDHIVADLKDPDQPERIDAAMHSLRELAQPHCQIDKYRFKNLVGRVHDWIFLYMEASAHPANVVEILQNIIQRPWDAALPDALRRRILSIIEPLKVPGE